MARFSPNQRVGVLGEHGAPVPGDVGEEGIGYLLEYQCINQGGRGVREVRCHHILTPKNDPLAGVW